MSRRSRWVDALIFAAPLALPAAPAAVAQDLPELRARIDRAAASARNAGDSITAITVRVRRYVPPDSMVSGAIVIRFNANDVHGRARDALEAGAALAWREMSVFLGSRASSAAQGASITALPHSGAFLTDQLTLVLTGSPGRRGDAEVARARPIATAIEELLGSVAALRAPAAVDQWAGGWEPVRPLEDAAWAAAAIDLATSNSAATRACYAGSLLQCESALGLTVVKDSLTEWYAPEDWRVLVASSQQGLNLDLPTRHAWKACVDGHDLPACERLARTRRTPVPLSHATRQSLYEFAMTRGGDGAYARLLAAKGTAFEAVTAAAGTSGDSLIARWRVQLLASMPPSARPSALEFTIALAWTGLFATAAMRKGR